MRLPWRYRLHKRLPRWAARFWGYDWAEDDRLTRDQVLAIFYSLKPEPTVGPVRVMGAWIERDTNWTTGAGSTTTILNWRY